MLINLRGFRQFVVWAAQVGGAGIVQGLVGVLCLCQMRPQRLLVAAAHKRQAQLCQRIEFLLIPPNTTDTANLAFAQSKHDGGFVGAFDVFLRYTAAAFAALLCRGFMFDGDKVAVQNQITGNARPAVDDGQGKPLRRPLYL